jgi:nicotinamidase-related amidase
MLPSGSENTALLLIDVQQGFKDSRWGKRNNPTAEQKIEELLNLFRKASLPVIHVQHLSTEATSPLRPGQPGVDFMAPLAPRVGERIFQKKVNSAFIGTNLENHLRSEGIQSLVMVGFTSDHCVSTSARMAANLGFNVFVVSDATVAFERSGVNSTYPPDIVHEVSLASLRGEFAVIATAAEIIADGDGIVGSR